MTNQANIGTTIGMANIKQRRLTELRLQSHPDLFVGQCVPFYFCPRSVMLYMYYRNDHRDLTYRGGQEPIIHLEADLYAVVNWANQNQKRWAFTLSNAGSRYFEDRCDLNQLGELNWQIIRSKMWASHKDEKQAEFLLEEFFPWGLVTRIGVISQEIYNDVDQILNNAPHRPTVEIRQNWYY